MKDEKWVPFIKHTKLNAHKVKLRRVNHLLLHADFSKLMGPNNICIVDGSWDYFVYLILHVANGFGFLGDLDLFQIDRFLWLLCCGNSTSSSCLLSNALIVHCKYTIAYLSLFHIMLKPMHQGYKFIIS